MYIRPQQDRARLFELPLHTESHPLDRLLMLRPMHRLRGGAALRVAGRRRADHRLHAVRRHASTSTGSDPQACKIPKRSIQSSVQTTSPTSFPALMRTPLYFSGLEPTKPRFSTAPPTCAVRRPLPAADSHTSIVNARRGRSPYELSVSCLPSTGRPYRAAYGQETSKLKRR